MSSIISNWYDCQLILCCINWCLSVYSSCWCSMPRSISVIFYYFLFPCTMMILILCGIKFIYSCLPYAYVNHCFCSLFLCALSFCLVDKAHFIPFNFFLVWKFKLWKKGGRIGFYSLSDGFCALLDLCLGIRNAIYFFPYSIWVFCCFLVDFSVQTLDAVCRQSWSLNFFKLQLSHF